MSLQYYISKFLKKTLNLPAIKNSLVDKKAKIFSGAHIVNSQIGRYSYIGNFTSIINTSIGRFCSIADYCCIGPAEHRMDFVSMSPVFHEGKNGLKTNFSNHKAAKTKQTNIGNDVWIGRNVLIKAGVTIGNGSIIGMGSVVTKNIGDYEIWAGNPARLIKKRFNDEIIESLINKKWWNNDESLLEKEAIYFDDVIKYLDQEKAIEKTLNTVDFSGTIQT